MLDKLESSKAKLVYLYIESKEVVTLDDICSDLHLKAISVYPVLRTLSSKNLIEKTDYRYRVQ